jgi:hypothetical protein
MIEKEFLRQQQALEKAMIERRRQRSFGSGLESQQQPDTAMMLMKDHGDDNQHDGHDDQTWNYKDDDNEDDDMPDGGHYHDVSQVPISQ